MTSEISEFSKVETVVCILTISVPVFIWNIYGMIMVIQSIMLC